MRTFKRLRRKITNREQYDDRRDAPQRRKNGLMRLPVEIRLQIWRELIGGKLCHMAVTGTYGLECYPCQEFTKDESGVAKLAPYSRDGLTMRYKGEFTDEAEHISYLQKVPFYTLSILLTSRAIHSEALGVLYGSNTFHIDVLQTLPAMVRVMGPRMKMIKTIHIDLNVWHIRLKDNDSTYDEVYESWIKKWDLFAKEFSGLQHLRLDIWGVAPNRDFHRNDLEALLKLSGLKTFRLAIWHHRGDAEDQELPISGPIERFFQDRICGGAAVE
ncbi:MAG: hypothetical protein Q9221_002157 [Calogaya cf. arnoldii]